MANTVDLTQCPAKVTKAVTKRGTLEVTIETARDTLMVYVSPTGLIRLKSIPTAHPTGRPTIREKR